MLEFSIHLAYCEVAQLALFLWGRRLHLCLARRAEQVVVLIHHLLGGQGVRDHLVLVLEQVPVPQGVRPEGHRVDFLFCQEFPEVWMAGLVRSLEELVRLDARERDSHVRLSHKNLREQVPCTCVHGFALILDLARDNLFVDLHRVVPLFKRQRTTCTLSEINLLTQSKVQ